MEINNNKFLQIISKSFKEFIKSGTSRSTQKLKPLHGAIAEDLANILGDNYKILSQGYKKGKEGEIEGRYINKKVDITITQNGKAIGGVAVKFVMQNYAQNSNNYFENMLGETANIRSNKCPYFQIFIILDKLPYYDKKKNIKHWEAFTNTKIKKYITMSNDNTDMFFHTPNKTLIFVVHPVDNNNLKNQKEYLDFYKDRTELILSLNKYESCGNAVIINDYKKFMEKVFHTIKSL